MEIKKSPKADLERKSPWWFFIGLGINISIFVALLECSPSESNVSVDDMSRHMENIVKTTEMIPAEETSPVVAEKKKHDENTVNEEIEVVDNSDAAEFLKPESVFGNDTIEVVGKETDDKPLERTDVVTDLTLLEEIPSYPGGMSQFVKWLTANLHYPESSRKSKFQGVVVATFIIETDGSVSDLKIARALRKDCDDEVLRVLNKMDKWTPGKKNGKPCRTLFCIPVEFKL